MNMRQHIDPIDATHETLDAAKTVMRNVAGNAGANFQKAYSTSKKNIDRAIDAASDGVESAEAMLIKRIKQHPVSATAIALGAGVFIGLMISRRK